MPYPATKEYSFDVPASTVTRANGGFKDGDTDVIGRWVQRGTGNTVVLVAENQRPLGVLMRITGTKCAVAISGRVRGKRGSDVVIPAGSRVVGDVRQESATGSDERGFVKAGLTDTAPNLSLSRGYTINGGTSGTANTAAQFVEVVI